MNYWLNKNSSVYQIVRINQAYILYYVFRNKAGHELALVPDQIEADSVLDKGDWFTILDTGQTYNGGSQPQKIYRLRKRVVTEKA